MTTKINTNEDWNHLLELAESDNNMAQYEVAVIYDSGLVIEGVEIVEESESEAFKWYYKAYQNGNIDVITRIADFFSQGIHCEQNLDLAIELYQKEIDKGYGLAANNLATVYRDLKDYKKAFEFYKIAQDLDNSDSLPLALCYYFGIGTEKNLKTSLEILLKISEDKSQSGNHQYAIDEANYFLGRIYFDGEIVEKSIIKARAFLEIANADNDHRSAQELLYIVGKSD